MMSRNGAPPQGLESIPIPPKFPSMGPPECPPAAGRVSAGHSAYGLLLLLLALHAAGCRPGSDASDPAELAAYRYQFLLTEEPAAPMGVQELRARLLHAVADRPDGALPEPIPGPVVGIIGGIPNPWGAAEPDYPWRDGQAKFFLSDGGVAEEITKHSNDHHHAGGHACPFCAPGEHRAAVAIVQFRAQDNSTIDIDARPLFGLQGGETIVLRGTASLLGEGNAACLVIAADGIYVRTRPSARD